MGKMDLVSGLIVAALVAILGMVIIFAEDLVWSVFQMVYTQLGIEAQPSRFWPMLVDTIGLLFVALGLYFSWKVWRRWRGQA